MKIMRRSSSSNLGVVVKTIFKSLTEIWYKMLARAAQGLQHRFEQLSLRSKQIFVLTFSLSCIIICVTIITTSIRIRSPVQIQASLPKLPNGFRQSLFRNLSIPTTDGVSENARIKVFRHFMDSLATTESGNKIRDSIIRVRPGLMDSLLNIEKQMSFK